jgi:alkylation response protein AidB-like acyl-CoA dehydrogenase
VEEKEAMYLRNRPVSNIVLDNVILTETPRPGVINQGSSIANQTLSAVEAAQMLGTVRPAVANAAAYPNQQVQSGHPISALQIIQTLLTETATDCHMARLALRYTADLMKQSKQTI